MDTDSILHLEEPIPNNCIITLNTLQYFFYCSGHIDIRDPDGNRLESIGYGIKRDNLESSIYRLKEQIYVLECLLCKLNNSLQLPTHAVSALGYPSRDRPGIPIRSNQGGTCLSRSRAGER